MFPWGTRYPLSRCRKDTDLHAERNVARLHPSRDIKQSRFNSIPQASRTVAEGRCTRKLSSLQGLVSDVSFLWQVHEATLVMGQEGHGGKRSIRKLIIADSKLLGGPLWT